MKIFSWLIIHITSISLAWAHADHYYNNLPTQNTSAIEHPFVTGHLFEIILDRCVPDNVYLYLSDRQTNQPIINAQIEFTASGDITLKGKAETLKSEGVYLLPLKARTGDKIMLKFIISASSNRETLSLTIPQWPNAADNCENEGG